MDTQESARNFPSPAPTQCLQSAISVPSILQPNSTDSLVDSTPQTSPFRAQKGVAVWYQNGSCSSAPVSPVGKFFILKGTQETPLEDMWAHDVLKAIGNGISVRAHMVSVYDEIELEGREYYIVNTASRSYSHFCRFMTNEIQTTTKKVDGLDAKYLIPIFPFDNRNFPWHDTHDIQYKLDNEDNEWTPDCGRPYRSKLILNTYLRLDNVFTIPKCLTKNSPGENGGCFRLNTASCAHYVDFIKKENIFEGSWENPLWKVKKELLANLPPRGLPRGGELRYYHGGSPRAPWTYPRIIQNNFRVSGEGYAGRNGHQSVYEYGSSSTANWRGERNGHDTSRSGSHYWRNGRTNDNHRDRGRRDDRWNNRGWKNTRHKRSRDRNTRSNGGGHGNRQSGSNYPQYRDRTERVLGLEFERDRDYGQSSRSSANREKKDRSDCRGAYRSDSWRPRDGWR